MKIIPYVVTIFFCLMLLRTSFAQGNVYYTKNKVLIRQYLEGAVNDKMCEGVIDFPTKYTNRKIRSDAFVSKFINNVNNDQLSGLDLQMFLAASGKRRAIVVNESSDGLINTKEILLKGGYVRAKVILGFVNDIVVRRKVTVTTRGYAKCGVYDNRLMDFKYIMDHFIVDLRLLFNVDYDFISSDSIFQKNLQYLDSLFDDYQFDTILEYQENWVAEILGRQFQSDSIDAYNFNDAPECFVKLIKEDKIEVIESLAFSPSYITSVNAMESLIFLSSVGKIQLSQALFARMKKIKDGSFKILQRGAPDVIYEREGYRELGMTDEKVIQKYKGSLSKYGFALD